jgi:hypothetical protein
MSANATGVCDICGAGISSPDGYLLVTRQVVSEPKYWQHYYRQHADEFAMLGVGTFEAFKNNPALRAQCAKTLAGQSTPWMVCSVCIGMFPVDQPARQRDAVEWWRTGGAFQPQGNGPAPLSLVKMDMAAPQPIPKPAKPAGLFDSLTRPRRIKRIWEQATHFSTSAEATQELCNELLEMLDERSTQPDIGRVYIVRGNSHFVQKGYEQALEDYSRAAEFFHQRQDLTGILDSERRMRFLHENRIPEQAERGSEKAEKLQDILVTSALIKLEWNFMSAHQVETLLNYLGDPDPDVRAYAAFRLCEAPIFKPEAKDWLVKTYRHALAQDDDRSARIGRRVGDLLCMGPSDVIPADLVWMKLGTDLPRSFVNCTCAFCGYLNRGIPVPPRGYTIPYFARVERQGKYGVPVLCVRCSREFTLTWDTDPRDQKGK